MKNTEKEYKIKQSKKLKRILVGTGISVTALCLVYITQKDDLKQEKESTTIETEANKDTINCNGRDEYMRMYMENMKELEQKEYDLNFREIYKQSNDMKLIIDEEELPIKSVFIASADDGNDHLLIAGENKTDILTKKPIEGRNDYYTFRDSSMFYQMYKDGIINNNEIRISKEKMQEYLTNWDHEINDGIQEIEAKYKTNEEYREKHGK